MERHLSHSALISLFSGEAERSEVDAAVPHLVRCRPCLDRTAGAVAELKRAGRLVRSEDARSAILTLLEVAESYAESRLLARAAWAELQGLSSEEQIERIRTEPSLQIFEMFEVLIEEAAGLAPHDPFLGEETALVAHALAGCLPRTRFSQALRNDLMGEAMETVGNCRRLAADWRGCAAALGAARKHLDQGTGKPAREARLLSFQASLATDTGNLEQAQTLLARAAELHREAGDQSALASITVQEASTLLAARRHEEAVARAEEVLSLLTPRETRLEMLARNVITECLVFLGRPAAGLKSHLAARPLRDQHRHRRTELQCEYLEGLLLDSLGHAREAEKAFRSNIASRMEDELYKDAFLTLLTRFELLYRRGETDKASRACGRDDPAGRGGLPRPDGRALAQAPGHRSRAAVDGAPPAGGPSLPPAALERSREAGSPGAGRGQPGSRRASPAAVDDARAEAPCGRHRRRGGLRGRRPCHGAGAPRPGARRGWPRAVPGQP